MTYAQMNRPHPAPVLEPDFNEFDDTDLDEDVLRQNAFENSEHDASAIYMDRLDEQFME